jgi:hypothetical protein
VAALYTELSRQVGSVHRGDMRRAESMLLAQAHTLDALFSALTARALANAGQYMDAADTYMRLALRAQSQCRATLEALALLKNPPHPTFVRQANIAHGPQQVNNGASPPVAPAREGDSTSAPSRLLEQQHEQWLDTGAAGATAAGDPAVAPVGAGNGAPDTRR